MKQITILVSIIVVASFFIKKSNAISMLNNKENQSIERLLDSNIVLINNNLITPKKDENDWSYPWYMVKYGDGQFENTFGDKIRNEDTMRLYHLSHCYSFIEKDTISRLKHTKAKKKGEKIQIRLFDESASNNESLKLEINNLETFRLEYNISYVFPYDSIKITFGKQILEIDKSSYQKGESLIGNIDCSLEETIYTSKNNKQEIRSKRKNLKGIFEAIIE